MYSDREIEAINIQCFYRKICPMPVILLFFDVSCLLVLYSLFYFFKIIFNTIYSFSIFYPPIPPRSYPSNFVVFLFLKKKWWKTKNKNQRKQTKKNKKINKTKKSQNNSVQNIMLPIFFGQILLGMGTAPECVLYTQKYYIEENWLSLSRKSSITNNVLFKSETFCPHPLLSSPSF